MKKDDADVYEFTNPRRALDVVDLALQRQSPFAVATEIGVTPQAISLWRKGNVEQLSMKVARRVRRLARRIAK